MAPSCFQFFALLQLQRRVQRCADKACSKREVATLQEHDKISAAPALETNLPLEVAANPAALALGGYKQVNKPNGDTKEAINFSSASFLKHVSEKHGFIFNTCTGAVGFNLKNAILFHI